MIKKTTVLICSCALAFALTARAQTPTPPDNVATAPTLTATPLPNTTPPLPALATLPQTAVTITPTPALPRAAAPSTEDEFDRAVDRKMKKHFSLDFDGDHSGHDSEIPDAVLPIVLVGCLFFFGTPIAIVGLILYFGFSKSRAMHKTVRMMVEKGQPVPEALLNPPPIVRQRSDLRRGIVLLMIGTGLIVFLGAVNDWEGGVWSLGAIPFLIGLGYLLVWRLDVHRETPSPKL